MTQATKEESLESKSVLVSKQFMSGQGISALGAIRLVQFFASGGTLAAADPSLLYDVGLLVWGQAVSFWRYVGDNKKLHVKKPKNNYTVTELDD